MMGVGLRLVLLPASAAILIAAASPGRAAEGSPAATVSVTHAWARATPKGATIGAGYVTIVNGGAEPDRLLAVRADIAARTSPHAMHMDGGVMTMRPIEGGVPIPPHDRIVFGPGGTHLMFEGLKQPLRKGDHVAATLTFEKAGERSVSFDVEGVGSRGPAAEGPAGMDMDMPASR